MTPISFFTLFLHYTIYILEMSNEWQNNLLDLDSLDWAGFNQELDSFWDLDMASAFVTTRKILSKSVRGLSSQQRAISLDLMACGIASGIWSDEDVALERLKTYWQWFKTETEKNAGLSSLLKSYVNQEDKNAKSGSKPLEIHTAQLRCQIDTWVTQGWLYEKPNPKEVKELMLDLGMRHYQGKWIKG
jgi:hypothetical protein